MIIHQIYIGDELAIYWTISALPMIILPALPVSSFLVNKEEREREYLTDIYTHTHAIYH